MKYLSMENGWVGGGGGGGWWGNRGALAHQDLKPCPPSMFFVLFFFNLYVCVIIFSELSSENKSDC